MKVNGPTDGAAIINISATLQDQATPFQLHAAAAKAGIDVLTNTLAVEWGEYGIRCVGLAPGGIAGTVGGPGGRVFGKNENNTSSDKVGAASMIDLSAGPTPEALRRRGNPSGRWGRVEDVALSALYMCTDAGGWISGTRLVVDGGTAHRAAGFLDAKRAIEKKSKSERASFSGGIAKAKL